MSYTPTIWAPGDTITAEKLNHLEQGVANAQYDSWANILQLVRAGDGPRVFPVGTQLRVNHANYGQHMFDVVAHDHLKKAGDVNAHTMTILQHDLLNAWIMFDQREAFYAAVSAALPAGTYSFTLPTSYGSWAAGTYHFTLTQQLPKGGQLAIDGDSSAALTSRHVAAYATRRTATITETVAISSGSGGTNLGTWGTTLNHVERVTAGSNNYKESAARQFLNSDAAAGSVWEPQTIYDRTPAWLSTLDGYKRGLGADFLAAVCAVTLPCAANNVYESSDSTTAKGAAYTLEDRFYVPSRAEIGFSAGDIEDGSGVFAYFAGASNADRIKQRNGAATIWWTRTPVSNTARQYRTVGVDGAMSAGAANGSSGYAVCCTIG